MDQREKARSNGSEKSLQTSMVEDEEKKELQEKLKWITDERQLDQKDIDDLYFEKSERRENTTQFGVELKKSHSN